MKKPKRRVYTIQDLANIAEQLGCRVRFELLPADTMTVTGQCEHAWQTDGLGPTHCGKCGQRS